VAKYREIYQAIQAGDAELARNKSYEVIASGLSSMGGVNAEQGIEQPSNEISGGLNQGLNHSGISSSVTL